MGESAGRGVDKKIDEMETPGIAGMRDEYRKEKTYTKVKLKVLD